MNDSIKQKTDNIEQRVTRSNKHNAVWTSAWLLSLIGLTFGTKFLWDYQTSLTLIALIFNLFSGYKMIMANKRLIEVMDELQRRVHLNAMAITLGVSVVFGAIYGLLDDIQLIPFELHHSNILFVMGPTYLLCVLLGMKKYS